MSEIRPCNSVLAEVPASSGRSPCLSDTIAIDVTVMVRLIVFLQGPKIVSIEANSYTVEGTIPLHSWGATFRRTSTRTQRRLCLTYSIDIYLPIVICCASLYLSSLDRFIGPRVKMKLTIGPPSLKGVPRSHFGIPNFPGLGVNRSAPSLAPDMSKLKLHFMCRVLDPE